MVNQQPKALRGQSGPVVIGLIIRNSTARQVGNYRAESQAELAERGAGRRQEPGPGGDLEWQREQGHVRPGEPVGEVGVAVGAE